MERKEWVQGQSTTPTHVYFWGSDKNGFLGPDKKPRTVYTKPQFFNFGIKIDYLACGEEHVAFVANGYLYTMGDNSDGRLGISKNVKSASSPCLVETLKRSYIVKVACGAKHSAALTDLGEAFTWGCGEDGQLGLGDGENQLTPQYIRLGNNDLKVRNEIPETVMDISCGAKHTGIVTRSGNLYMFGNNEFGQLGTGATEAEYFPVKITTPKEKIQNVSCGNCHTLLLTIQGAIFACGLNTSGELGIGNTQNAIIPTKVLIPEDVKIAKISAGYHSAAVSVRSELYIWGECSLGSYVTPRKIPWENGVEIVSVQMGDNFTVLADRKGYLWSFGNNSSGELGTGSVDNYSSIVQISNLTSVKVKVFCCGKNFVMALADISQGPKGNKEIDSDIKKNRRQNSKQYDKKMNEKYIEQEDGRLVPIKEDSFRSSRGQGKMFESDLDTLGDNYQTFSKRINQGFIEKEEKTPLDVNGQYMSPGRMRDEQPVNIKGGRNFETNMDTETDELREGSQTFSTQNQITDYNYESIWNTLNNDKDERIRNILVDIKILRLQNALLEQQLEERSQQIASLRRKMREIAFSGKKNQENEQKMKELVLKYEAQSLKYREEFLKSSEEILKRDAEIDKIRKAIAEKNAHIENLVKDNNTLKELVFTFLELRDVEKDVPNKDKEAISLLENRIQALLENLNFASINPQFQNTQLSETHKTETMQDFYKNPEGSNDHKVFSTSNSPKSLLTQKQGQKKNQGNIVTENLSGRRFSPSKESILSHPTLEKERGFSTAPGSLYQAETSIATEEPRVTTRGLKPETKTKPQKTHTKSQCSLNLTNLISPKNGLAVPSDFQKVITSAKHSKNEGPISFHKKKLSEPLLNFKHVTQIPEEKIHKDMVGSNLKTLDNLDKHVTKTKGSRNSQSYVQNNFTPVKDNSKKMTATTQISPLNGAKDSRKPEVSQLYRKLLMLHFPSKLPQNNSLKTGIKSNVTGKQNHQK